jgi:hypothetical protein
MEKAASEKSANKWLNVPIIATITRLLCWELMRLTSTDALIMSVTAALTMSTVFVIIYAWSLIKR